ncbi:MAG: 2-amino-4-hydroxy-6-hydroxymethyldihydropteridine diphosphokinase [Pseudomonadota bacterium]|nr:2-amino-4-hydroxy-6-hydroxymethyldihydropteridine diphosphokinase [Pseudomonadota bacterium]
MNKFIISLGSNIDSENNLSRAISILSCITDVIQISKTYQTPSIKKGLPNFLNQALSIQTNLDQNSLKKEMLEIEKMLGRKRTKDAYDSRTIDIDICLINGQWTDDALNSLNHEQLIVALLDIIPKKKITDEKTLLEHYLSITKRNTKVIKSKQKTVMITGASKRIGRYLAISFAKKGYNVIAHYNKSQTEAKTLKKLIETLGQKCILWKKDLSHTSTFDNIFKKHKIDLLVNSAALFYSDADIKQNPKLEKHQWNVNLIGPKNMINAYLKHQKKGHVINILDNEISKNNSKNSHYLTTKKFLHCLTSQMAAQYRPLFRFNAIAPGWILDPINQDKTYLDNQKKIQEKRLPRKGDVADLINTTLFLEESTYISGQTIFLDAGRHLT